MEIFKWENLSKTDLERHYNPRVAVPNAQDYIDDFIERSDEARKNINGSYDIRYGDKPKQTLDLHLPQNEKSSIIGLYSWRLLEGNR